VALGGDRTGTTQLAIGTHALFQEEVSFARLGLAIVDEQHRFGVEQRLALAAKRREERTAPADDERHPIPRTLSMSYYADLDVTVIDELPPGPHAGRHQARLRGAARRGGRAHSRELRRGRASLLGVPLDRGVGAVAIEDRDRHLRDHQEDFSDLSVGLVHGRLKSVEKAQVMAAFKARVIQLLVATTVIEVGVDVPNATLMVIEHAERMGLAQLHQLRGRVGRGSQQSLAILLYAQPLSEMARARLKVIYESNDGFEIAREDLRLRGPGEFLGARQSGAPLLRFADLERDLDLIEAARGVADELIAAKSPVAVAPSRPMARSRQFYLKA
jgi:ATP-dependent DNA helicase RecG